jgi:hypothetical protein
MRGRPSHYTADIADRILAEMTRDRPLGAICRDPGMPPVRTVYQWIRDDREGFAARFRACRKAAGAKIGRPSTYSPERAEHIAGGLIGGRNLADVCRDPGMPTPSTVCNWAIQDRDGFAARYRMAREVGYITMCDELIDIGDNGSDDGNAPGGPDGTTRRVRTRRNVERDRLRCAELILQISRTFPRSHGGRPTLLQRLAAREARKK